MKPSPNFNRLYQVSQNITIVVLDDFSVTGGYKNTNSVCIW